ncbi:MAG: galactose oxidase, partial [Cyclobacteriaceae bacterium]
CHISKETGYWKVKMDPTKIKVDYLQYHHIVQHKSILNKKNIQKLISIVQRGSILSNLEYEWLDSFKAEISNEVIDIYIHFANSIDIAQDPEFMIEIANYISYFDLVNEEAMMLKCKALVHLGKHSLAKTVFENFKKEYKNIYDEDFIKDFQNILG